MSSKLSRKVIAKAIENSNSMLGAAAFLGIQFSTFKRWAMQYNLYNPNQGGKGFSKNRIKGKIPLSEILNGQHPSYQSFKLKHRLFQEGIKSNICEKCGISSWNNSTLECELHHEDGVRTNHRLENLTILCPNCHSQTINFRFKKRI